MDSISQQLLAGSDKSQQDRSSVAPNAYPSKTSQSASELSRKNIDNAAYQEDVVSINLKTILNLTIHKKCDLRSRFGALPLRKVRRLNFRNMHREQGCF